MDTLSRKLFKSRDARTKLRGMGGILSSSPELVQTVQKYQDGGDVDAGFGSNVEYTYSTFLAENNLNDTPQAREMFARYKVYMDTREAPSDPKLFSPVGFDRAPAGLGDAPMMTPMASGVEFDPTRQYTSPDMPSAPAELSEIGTDIPYIRQTSPAAPAAPLSTLDQLRGSVYSTNPLENALADTGLDSNFIGTSIIDPITGRIKEIIAGDAARNQGYKDSAAEASRQADFRAVGQSFDNDALLSSGAPVIDPSAIRTNVDLAYGGSGDLYQQGIAGQMSAVRSLGDGELISIVGDPSNSLYGAAVEEMANRRMDFGEKPVIAAQKINRDAESRLFAAQEQLRAATTPTETIAAEAAIRDAEAGLQEAVLNQENTPRSVLEPAVDLTPSELLAQELGMDYVPGSETPVVEAPAAGAATETPVVEAPAPDADAETPAPDGGAGTGTGTGTLQVDPEKLAPLMPQPGDTDADVRSKYKDRLKLFQEILGEDEAGARNKGMDLAMIGLAIMSGQSPNFLTNIAQGGAAGLQAMSAQDEAAREWQRLVRTTALESVLDEEATASASAATAAEKALDRQTRLDVANIGAAGGTDYTPAELVTYRTAYNAAFKAATERGAKPQAVKDGMAPEVYATQMADSAVTSSRTFFSGETQPSVKPPPGAVSSPQELEAAAKAAGRPTFVYNGMEYPVR